MRRFESRANTYALAQQILPLVPRPAVVSRVDNVKVGRKLLAAAQRKPALGLDGAHHERPVEFHLNPFLAGRVGPDRLHWAPGAAEQVLVESAEIDWGVVLVRELIVCLFRSGCGRAPEQQLPNPFARLATKRGHIIKERGRL